MKEHKDKVRLTKEDLQKRNTLAAEKRMSKEDGGLAHHAMECQSDVNWEDTTIVAKETGLGQRKVLEGIESLRVKHHEMKAINNFDHPETWKPVF